MEGYSESSSRIRRFLPGKNIWSICSSRLETRPSISMASPLSFLNQVWNSNIKVDIRTIIKTISYLFKGALFISNIYSTATTGNKKLVIKCRTEIINHPVSVFVLKTFSQSFSIGLLKIVNTIEIIASIVAVSIITVLKIYLLFVGMLPR
jgi:hypothetical protein